MSIEYWLEISEFYWLILQKSMQKAIVDVNANFYNEIFVDYFASLTKLEDFAYQLFALICRMWKEWYSCWTNFWNCDKCESTHSAVRFGMNENEAVHMPIITVKNRPCFNSRFTYLRKDDEFSMIERKRWNDFRAKGDDTSGPFKELIFNESEKQRGVEGGILPLDYNNGCAIKL